MKYAIGARSITPRAQNPMQPQNVRHRRPTNSIGMTKLTTMVPVRQTERIEFMLALYKNGLSKLDKAEPTHKISVNVY